MTDPTPTPTPTPTPAPATPPEPKEDAGKVAFTAEQQAHLDKLIGDARKEGRTAAEVDAKRKADEESAKAKGEWETLASKRAERVAELEGEVSKRDRADLVRRVAAKHKLPEALGNRLEGETEAELEADAKELAKLVDPRRAPDTEAGAGRRGAGSAAGDRPVPKADGQKQPAYTFDGRPKVAWPTG